MSTIPDGERIAVLETKVATLEKTIEGMASDLHEIKQAVTEAKGGWKTLVALGTIASTLGGFVTWILSNIRFGG